MNEHYGEMFKFLRSELKLEVISLHIDSELAI